MHIYDDKTARLIGLTTYDTLNVKPSRHKGLYCIEYSSRAGSGEILHYKDRESASLELYCIASALIDRRKVYQASYNISEV